MTVDRKEFLSALAHAVKGPVHNALGFVELLRMGRYGELDEGQEEVVTRIEGMAEDAAGQLEVLFGFLELIVESPEEAATGGEAADLPHCLRTAVREAPGDLAGLDHRLELHADSDCPPLAVAPAHLRFLFTLLIDRAASRGEPGAPVSVRVGDGAAGARPPLVPVVVESGRGGEEGGADGSSGSELGGDDASETIVRYLVRLHGGEVEFSNGADAFRAVCRLPVHDDT